MGKARHDDITGARVSALYQMLMLEGVPWNKDLRDELGVRWGVPTSKLRYYYQEVLRRVAKEMSILREEGRADFLRRVRAIQRRQQEAEGSMKDLIQLLGLEARVCGYYDPPPPPPEKPVDDTPMTEDAAVAQLASLPENLLQKALAKKKADAQ